MEHLAIMDKNTIEKILNGTKTIETRFSKNRITPYNKVKKDELVYLKESGGDILAVFKIGKVLFFKDLTGDKILEIKNKYNKFINAPDSYFAYKKDCEYGTLIFITNPKPITPITIFKKNRLAFLTVNSIINDLYIINSKKAKIK